MIRNKLSDELQRGLIASVVALILLLFPLRILAQTGPVVIGGGYRNPDAFQVAPGQVITIFMRNVKTLLPLYSTQTAPYRFVAANSTPLPTLLAGFSARVDAASQGGVYHSYAAPILGVQQLPICSDTSLNPPEPPATLECWVTAVTLQIPFAVRPQAIPAQPTIISYTLVASEDQADGTSVELNVKDDRIHFVTACDRIGTSNAYNGAGIPALGFFCRAIVAHGDGTAILPQSPAKPGEVIVLYAYGLGLTSENPPGDGSPAPVPALRVKNALNMQFDFRPSAGPSIPQMDPKDTSASAILFAGLAPGEVGLYQINVKLPDVFPPVAPCGFYVSNFTGNVSSNLTINISGLNSFDGAQICVASGS